VSSASRLPLLVALAALAVAAVATPSARADGDPASDYLLSQDVFVPFDGKIPTSSAGQLDTLVRNANRRGYRIKVAMIATPYDLGSVTALWKQPQRYARFLGQELEFVYKDGRLLIAMPNGYGVYNHGKPVTSETKLLAGLSPPAGGGEALASGAIDAVRRLARADGVALAVPKAAAKPSHSANADRITIIGFALIGAAVVAAIYFARRVRGRPEPATPERRD
jgi:hypothetical protein